MKQDSGVKAKKQSALRSSGNMNVLMILIGFMVIIALIQVISSALAGNLQFPSIFSPSNLTNIIAQVSPVGIMAMGMAIVMIAGGIDLSVGMLTSFVVLYVAKSFIDWGYALPVSIIVAIGFAVLMETAMGFVISRLKVEPFIVTLGGMITFRGIALLIVNSQEISMQGALDGLKETFTKTLSGVEIKDFTGRIVNIPWYVFIFIGVTVFVWLLMKYTKYGRRVYAVGANPQAAYLAGIDVKNIVMSTYALSGILVGVGAICLLARVNTAIINTGQNKEIDVIAAAVVGGIAMSGGKGNIWGVFLGAILMGAIENGMNMLGLQSEWQYVVKGIIIIAAVSASSIAATLQSRKQLRQQQSMAKHANKA